MIIKVDNEGNQVLGQLLDTFLKVNGLNSLDSVNKMRSSVQLIEEEKKDILNPNEIKDGNKEK